MFKLSPSIDMILCLMFVVLTVLNLNICCAAEDIEQVKPRRGGTVGLFAFPRVGRSDASLYNYAPNPNSYEEYDDIPKMEWKRQGLVAFPRVGRSDNQLHKWSKLAMQQQDLEKRTGASASSGLWFGPRLGRIQKRNANTGGMSGDHF